MCGCVDHSCFQVIEYLLYCNANKHAQNNKGWSPLHFAASYGKAEVVIRLILDPGSQRSIKDNLGSTPLHEAVRSNQLACVKLLVEDGTTPPGADRNAVTLTGNTPMHLASFLGFTDVVKYILSQNADCNIRNSHKQFAMDVAKTHELMLVLKEATTVKKNCFWFCCYSDK
jgi:ankyrin repeat protein